jgi:hypothetical protein
MTCTEVTFPQNAGVTKIGGARRRIRPVGDDFRMFLRWLQGRPVPLGHFTPLAASVLFAAAHFAHSSVFRFAGYAIASILAILLAIDLASDLLDSDSQDREASTTRPKVPLTIFQFVLTGIQASLYSFFVFVGLGPFTPLIFIVPVFAFSSLAAWRNVRLWYREGTAFEDRLREAGEEESERLLRLSHESTQQPRPT